MTVRDRDSADRSATREHDLVKVGISACLLGEAVRYDGGHKYEPFVAVLADRFSLVPMCPEMEIGLGAPREALHLVYHNGEVRVIADGGIDHTSAMLGFAARRLHDLAQAGLCGYVFKKGSPSCGLRDIAVAGGASGAPGLFANALVRQMPSLPVEEETALRDPASLAAFIERVLAYHRRTTTRP